MKKKEENWQDIEKLREQINAVDNQLIDLLNERTSHVLEIGKLKEVAGSRIYRPNREKEIIDRLSKRSEGKLLGESAISSIMLEIFAVSRNYEFPTVVAYLGPEASFTHQAATSRFGALTKYKSLTTIKSVISAVASEQVTYGVVPIENNSQGMVGETIDLLAVHDVSIMAEIVIPIHFCFAALNNDMEKITKIYSKDVAFNQCRNFVQEFVNLDKVEVIPVESTSKAALLATKETNASAICSHIAAKLNQLPILFKDIEDTQDNYTRFYILSKHPDYSERENAKTTIITRLHNDIESGRLYEFLRDFKSKKVNIIKLSSHPAKEGKKFKYWFFIEFDGHILDKPVQKIISKHAEHIKVMGSYLKII